MQPHRILSLIKSDMVQYISSKFPFHERGRNDLNQQLISLLSQPGRLFQDPVLQLVRPRLPGNFDRNLFHTSLHPKLPPTPYAHQIKAWNRLSQGMPTVVATGTGSGKSECFMFPMIDGLLKAGFASKGPRVGAICLYPMNALVEDQFFRLLRLTAGTGITVGIYNGTYKKLSPTVRNKIMERAAKENYKVDPATFFVNPENTKTTPHILLTNYKMLEYMLLRTQDHNLFRGTDLRYLVLDEAHTYTGTLGLEIACLLSRLRVHLGEAAEHFVPVATSATLMQNAVGQDEATKGDGNRHDMRNFFSQLFGKDFPEDSAWLIEDEFVPLPTFDRGLLAPYLRADSAQLEQALDTEYPLGLQKIANLFGINVPLEAPSEADKRKLAYNALARAIYPHMSKVAGHLAASILVRMDGGGVDHVVSWSEACQRFYERTGGSAAHLEALLTLASQAYEDEKLPSMGLRVHIFGRSEPRLYWSFDGKVLTDEAGAQELEVPVGTFVSCRKCGHMAWSGIYTPADIGGGDGGYLENLPTFYETAKLAPGCEIMVLHRLEDVLEDTQDDGSMQKAKSWGIERYAVAFRPGSEGQRKRTTVRGVGPKSGGNIDGQIFARVTRKNSEGEDALDICHCPSCGSTSSEGEMPLLMTPRSGAATDLSVYTSSVMTNLDLAHERKLLLFADNRQETSFLAGFLTNRHRRLNLRRIIATFLKSASEVAAEKGGPDWKLLAQIEEDEQPEGHKYDFAARVLLSLVEKRFWGRDPLPSKLMVPRQILQEIIPREVLEVDFEDRKTGKESNDFKNWLLGNFSIESSGTDKAEEDVFSKVDVFGSPRGVWALKTLHEVMLLEISAVVGREGHLSTLGLVGWTFPGLKMDRFEAWYAEHPDALIGAQGLFTLSQWLISKLADVGQWQELDDSSRRHFLGKRGRADVRTLWEILGKGFEKGKGISKNSGLGRILVAYGGDQALKAWSKPAPWLDLIENGPLKVALSLSDLKVPKLRTQKVSILGNPVRYCGSVSGTIVSMDPRIDLAGQPTGRKGEVWEKYQGELHSYYRTLYQRSFEEDARLVRAHEHNGMIGGELASEVIESFDRGHINTLVATPTLEMGVDLPDLPAVFHRSVPPDPSNYAQRSGRAGRGPKRAIIITHCGSGSHDLTFYNDPKAMVSGEILPPGLPSENISIIKRHVNGLILEVLARDLGASNPHLVLDWWGSVVDLNELRTEVLRYDGVTSEFPVSQPIDWLGIVEKRRKSIDDAVSRFAELLDRGLWRHIKDERKVSLRQGVLGAGNPDKWAQNFRAELDAYLDKCRGYVADFAAWMAKGQTLDLKEDSVIRQQKQRAFKMVEMYLKASEENYPLSYLGMAGFLPNFDFPGKSIRFVGVLPQFADKGGKYAQARDKYLTFNRAAAVGLREFAPEQKVYGQGFVYRVDRYEADPKAKEGERSWGICTLGCTQLSEPEAKACSFCGGELVKSENDTSAHPKLVEVSGVQGLQEKVISDRDARRAYNPMVKEVRHRGIPEADNAYALDEENRVFWQLHLTPSAQIKTATILSAVAIDGDATSVVHMKPLMREVTDENSRVFKVRTSAPQELPPGVRYEEFLPTVWGEGQALVFNLPFAVALDRAWIEIRESRVEESDRFYATFAELLARSATRVLRLNKRKASLQFLDHKVCEIGADGTPQSRERCLLVLDGEEGGSGVIPLLWSYWDQIMEEAKRLALKTCCQKACYNCIMSYDNQIRHPILDKSLFVKFIDGERSALLFDAIKLSGQGVMRIHDVTSQREQTVDPRSPAEENLEEVLRAGFGHARKTQTSVKTADGREVSRPDFEITSGSGTDVSIFVDGWTYHRSLIRSDMSKRNRIARQHQRVMAIPARLLVPKVKEGVLMPLLLLLKRSEGIQIPLAAGFLKDLPFKTVDERFKKEISFSGLQLDKWQIVDHAALMTTINELMPKEVSQRISSLDHRHWPVGYQNGVLLWPLHAEELEAESSGQTWENVLIFHSVLAGLGSVNLFVEAKRGGHSAVA